MFTGYWQILTPKTRKDFYTTLSTDAYDPRATDGSSLSAVSWYASVMRGPNTRMSQYKQFDAMDADIDIARSLDIISEEMTNMDDKTNLPFIIDWQKEDNQDVSDSAVVTVRAALRQWTQLQQLTRRNFQIARKMVLYGDCFFKKSSDTRRWEYVDPINVVGIEVDQYGNKISYHIKQPTANAQAGVTRGDQVFIVPAAAMIHFSMSDEMGDSAPFGQSILRPIYRVYRQLSMLEDAVIIYRIVRAPERRVFYLDVGNMNAQQTKRYMETVKAEQRQKRIPGVSSNNASDVVDGAYDPQSISQDLFFPVTAGGRSSRVEVLPGGTEDFGTTLLKKFEEKIFRGLRIPTSYMGASTTGGTDPQTNDGKVGIAYIEELRFCKFIQRLQMRMNQIYDEEFKVYMKVCGLQIDDEVFQIRLPEPANFALYRQAALDADLVSSFKNIEDTDLLSRRLLLKRYLGLTDDEIQMNEVLRKEEQGIEDTPDYTAIQQLYDPAIYKNRDPIKIKKASEPEPGDEGTGQELGGDIGIGGETGGFGGGEQPGGEGSEEADLLTPEPEETGGAEPAAPAAPAGGETEQPA
jgi:hypothetical protein